jgi:fructokinase
VNQATGSNVEKHTLIQIGYFGEILVDVIVSPPPNKSETFIKLEARLGGAPINAAVVTSQFSSLVASYAICSIGDDWLGTFLHEQLRDYGVKTDFVRRLNNRTTSAAFFPVDSKGEQMWSEYHRDADLEITASSATSQKLAQLNGFGFGAPTLSQKTSLESLENISKQLSPSCKMAFDLNYRPRLWNTRKDYVDAINNWLPRCHLIKCNQTEGQLLTRGTNDPQSIIEGMAVTDEQFVFLTLGDKGSLIRHGGKIHAVPSIPVTGVAIGAGDAFFAGMITASCLLRRNNELTQISDQSLIELTRFSNACGSIANLHTGACSPDVAPNYANLFSEYLTNTVNT